MRLAKDICLNGVSASSGLCLALKQVIEEYCPIRIIETGTYHGTGTTKAIIEACILSQVKSILYSIESDKGNVELSKKNLAFYLTNHYCKFEVLSGVSVSKEEAFTTPLNYAHLPEDIIVDFVNPKDYTREIAHASRYNLLEECFARFDGEPDLVVLDSAGHLGLQEFLYVVENARKDFILALDDINHIKHHESKRLITEVAYNAEIIHQGEDKFGWLIAKIKI